MFSLPFAAYNQKLMNAIKAGSRCYSLAEAASKLGVSVLELRGLIQRYVTAAPLETELVLRDTDLIALKVLASRPETTIH